jgi:hypothetical protein
VVFRGNNPEKLFRSSYTPNMHLPTPDRVVSAIKRVNHLSGLWYPEEKEWMLEVETVYLAYPSGP